MGNKFCILCCENIRPEVDAVLATIALPRATVRSFPFHCGHVTSVWKTIRDQYHELEEAGARVCLCGCGCSNTLDIPKEVCKGSSLIFQGAGASLFLPEDLVTDYQKRGALLILPGWLSRWKQNADSDGLDPATAREMYAESVNEIILLDTGTHSGIAPVLAEFAQFTGLPARMIPVGIEHFLLSLTTRYLQWQYDQDTAVFKAKITASEKRVADYSMVADLTGKIIGVHDEKTVIHQMLDLFILLCSPKRAGFLPFNKGVAGSVVSIPNGAYVTENGQLSFPTPTGHYQIAETKDGFQYRVMYENQLIGVLSIDHVSLPDSLDEYLNLTHFISQIAGLSITIARTYEELKRAVAERDAEIVERNRAKEALQMAIKKLNMLSSITRHDILNQIMGLRTYLDLSREDLKGTRFAAFIEKEDQAAEAIQRQIEFTKYYQDIGVNAPEWQDAAAIIHAAVKQLNLPEIEVQVKVNGVEIFADPLIVKVFFNLMENSLRHGERVTKIDFSSSDSEEGLILTYCDNGVGITDEDKQKLFRKGFGKHTGLGLFLSQEILAITGITITENGEPGKGVQFEMTVPKEGYRFPA
ncbi:MAG: ATP-binding protein [Methanoregula sp.]|nr:ATP-binding protein [Methanoregula sp.]